MSDKRGLGLGALVLVLALGAVIWLLSREPSKPAPTEAPPAVVTGEPTPPEQPPGFDQAGGAPPEDLAPVEDAPMPLSNDGDAALADPSGPPIVAKGHVIWAGGTLPEDIDVILYDVDGSDLDLTTAAPDGKYELRWDEPLGEGWAVGTDSVMFAVDGKVLTLSPDNVAGLPAHMPGEPPVEVDLLIGHPPVITGRVTDRLTGAPIDGAEVNASSSQRAWALDTCFTMTEDDGSYVLELDDIPLRQLVVWCRADEWQAQMLGPQDVAFAPQPGAPLRIDFQLDQPLPWKGRVTSGIDGQPVGDATITVGNDLEAFSDYFDFEISDEEGFFELDLPDVPVEGAWVHVSAWDFAPVVLRDVRPGQDLNIILGLPVTLVGTVTGGGEPIEGAAISVAFDGETYWGDNGLYDEAFTDEAGAFDVELESAPADAARLRIEAEGFAPYDVKLSDVAKLAGAGKQEVTVTLTPSP